MSLRVAACPRCKGALVFGERACRSCAQTFQYGASPPPEPTFAQIVEALAAAGLPPPPGATPTPPTRSAANPFDNVIESGRFKNPGAVESEEIPGFIDSSLFKAFTPAHVDAPLVAGLDSGRFAEVGAVAPAVTPGLELSPKDTVGDVFTQPVSGLFHSDIFKTNVDVAPAGIEGLETSPSATRPPAPSGRPPETEAQKQKRKDDALGTILCRCGERHRLPRCPACGTAHPDS